MLLLDVPGAAGSCLGAAGSCLVLLAATWCCWLLPGAAGSYLVLLAPAWCCWLLPRAAGSYLVLLVHADHEQQANGIEAVGQHFAQVLLHHREGACGGERGDAGSGDNATTIVGQ